MTRNCATQPSSNSDPIKVILHHHAHTFADMILGQAAKRKKLVSQDEIDFTYRMFERASERIWEQEPHDKPVSPETWMAHFKAAAESAA